MQVLQYKNQSVAIEEGELVSYLVGKYEYIHQKGSAGWRNSDTEMFPIIGPTASAGFIVKTPKGMAVQDQHGLLRELNYELINVSKTIASYQKKYTGGTKVPNSKYPEKSSAKELFWPYDFQFTKHYELHKGHLEITFEISGEKGMPFMIGYHPAFKLRIDTPSLLTADREIALSEILAVGSRAMHLPNCSEVILRDQKNLKITTDGFGEFMLWTEVPNMVCIEPISFYPYAVSQDNLDEGFQQLENLNSRFKVLISPE
ncbi:MAG: aldose 1-epimerase [Flavobacteriaceae bacterium]